MAIDCKYWEPSIQEDGGYWWRCRLVYRWGVYTTVTYHTYIHCHIREWVSYTTVSPFVPSLGYHIAQLIDSQTPRCVTPTVNQNPVYQPQTGLDESKFQYIIGRLLSSSHWIMSRSWEYNPFTGLADDMTEEELALAKAIDNKRRCVALIYPFCFTD